MQHQPPKTKWKSVGNQGWEKSNLSGKGYEEAMAKLESEGKIPERRPIIAGNWKMNKTKAETKEFIKEFKEIEINSDVDTVLITPFTDLDTAIEEVGDSGIGVGAQNVHFETSGAYTGEISLDMLKEIGVGYCIVGHSERRQYFGETNKTCNQKIKKILAESDIVPILCVGENLQIRENGREDAYVEEQVRESLLGLTAEEAVNVVIAYEPIWAIGTGETATPEQAEAMCYVIRRKIFAMFGPETAAAVRIQYGGSVKPENAADVMACDDIDGALVGGASLKADSFANIVNYNG